MIKAAQSILTGEEVPPGWVLAIINFGSHRPRWPSTQFLGIEQPKGLSRLDAGGQGIGAEKIQRGHMPVVPLYP